MTPPGGTSSSPGDQAAFRRLHAFVRELLEATTRSCGDESAAPASLLLAEAALRYGPLARRPRPRQIAVVGPTQTGKSTLTNLLIGLPLAQVSPLAGFTVHPQGFCRLEPAADREWTAELFAGWTRRDPNELHRGELKAWSLVDASTAGLTARSESPNAMRNCVVWDTPDFDSLAAQGYRSGLFEVLGLADAYVFVLSKEKYADLAAWRILRLVAGLRRPLVVCVNKVPEEHQSLIEASLSDRLSREGGPAAAQVVSLRVHRAEGGIPADAPDARALLHAVGQVCAAGDPSVGATGALSFVREHWADWTAPLRREHAARDAWRELVRSSLGGCVEAYRRDFLEHPQRYDSFRRASAALLAMLEFPGLGTALGQVRQVLTWPARQVWRATKELLAPRRDGSVSRAANVESQVVSDVLDDLLASLTREAARRADATTAEAPFWRLLLRGLTGGGGELRDAFAAAANEHTRRIDAEIRAAAGEMYESLRQRPALLNTLRAARATTDVAGVALAVKTGGTGVNDLIFAPAMLAFTSLLTEGVLGAYVNRVASRLKARQLESVRSDVLDSVVEPALWRVAENLHGEGILGVSRAQLAAAEAALATLTQGRD